MSEGKVTFNMKKKGDDGRLNTEKEENDVGGVPYGGGRTPKYRRGLTVPAATVALANDEQYA